MKLKATVATLGLALTLAACGGGSSPKAGGTPTPTPSCEAPGTALTITAKNIAFDKTCLAASAGQAFTIAFTNDDSGTTHNISIFSAHPAKDPKAKIGRAHV